MTLQELSESIAFEAKIPDIDALGGWIELTIREVFDDYTAQLQYDDLYVPNTVIALPSAAGIIPLPTDLQHLDLNNVRFREGADSDKDYVLFAKNGVFGDNIGGPRLIVRNSTAANLGQLSIWPTDELTTSDQIVINYWRKVIPAGSATTLILVPDQLVQTVKMEVIARANTFGDSKQAAFYQKQARDKYSRSFGVTRTNSMNGD